LQGWIKLHRKIRSNAIFNDLQLFRLWVICLTEATHKGYDQPLGRQLLRVEQGQFITGRFDLHEMYNRGLKPKDRVAEKTVWRWLEKLQELEYLTIKTTNKYSIVSIDNWALYQGNEFDGDQLNDQQMTNKCPTNDQLMTTNKNVKNVKNDNNNTTTNKDDVDIIAEEYQALRRMAEGKEYIHPNLKDYQAIAQIVADGVPLPTTIKLLKQCFDEYKQNNPTGAISSFKYCYKYIKDKHEASLSKEKISEVKPNGEKSIQGDRRSPQKITGSSITKGKTGWIRKPSNLSL